MPIATNTEALRDMRSLQDTSTGRLRGLSASYARRNGADLANTPQPWRDRITTDLADRAAGSVGPASCAYLVFSDKVLIAALTVSAHLLLPDYELTTIQRRHQDLVRGALADLPRRTLRDMADRRATMDGRDEKAQFEYQPPSLGAIRIAGKDEPTVTHWVSINNDLSASRQEISRLGLGPDRLIIITAPHYGEYGRKRDCLELPMLCAMHRIADRHDVTLSGVGDWLAAEGATGAEVDPDGVVAAFAAAYLGPFLSEDAYTVHHMAEIGWTSALQRAEVPARYLNTAAVTRDWFTNNVRGIRCAARHRIEVFDRAVAHA
jgi:hypothetical protein